MEDEEGKKEYLQKIESNEENFIIKKVGTFIKNIREGFLGHSEVVQNHSVKMPLNIFKSSLSPQPLRNLFSKADYILKGLIANDDPF